MITIISVTYEQFKDYKLPTFVSNVIAQSEPNWKLIVSHDGPSSDGTKQFMDMVCKQNERIKYFESPQREHNPDAGYGWGHHNRARMLDMVDTEWVWFQNCDNQIIYDGVKLASAAGKDSDIVFFPIIHSHYGFTPFKRYFGINGADIASFIIRTDIAKAVGFNHRGFAADGYFMEEVKQKYSKIKINEIDSVLVIHN